MFDVKLHKRMFYAIQGKSPTASTYVQIDAIASNIEDPTLEKSRDLTLVII